MKTEQKQSYDSPELMIFGAVARITKQHNLENADVPQGTPGTAYPTGTPPGS